MIADLILPDLSWGLMVWQGLSQATKVATHAEPAAGSASPAAALPARRTGCVMEDSVERCANA
jgi:hypothetical protein